MNETISERKAAIRREAIAARRALRDRDQRSIEIANRLFALTALQDSETLLTYVAKDEEVDTRGIIERALQDGRTVLAPRVDNTHGLDWAPITSIDALQKGRFGVMEPPTNIESCVPPANAVALIPGVAFDQNGNRLGWGQGYFDRFLEGFRGLSIGLAFDCQLYKEVPHEPHDRPVQIVVTESQTIRTNDRTFP